jgi:DNA-damage-inducible protein D
MILFNEPPPVPTGGAGMSEELDHIFHFEEDRENFESLGLTNGARYWFARDLMKWLGYETWQSFTNAINRAIGTCTTLNISVADNFSQVRRVVNGVECDDYKLSRFACCLTALNGDTKKPRVAAAQTYFISFVEALKKYLSDIENIERVRIREEISEREVTLSGVAKSAGVNVYAFFQNAGIRGMYQRDTNTLKRMRNVPSARSLLDFMCKDELAYNLFRLSLTEGRIKRDGTRGQHQLEYVAEDVGRKVRKSVIDETGNRPEDLPVGQDIRLVQGSIKRAAREMKSLDKSKPKKK